MQLITDDLIDDEFGVPETLRGEILITETRHDDGALAGHISGWLILDLDTFRELKQKTSVERADAGWGDQENEFVINDF